MSNDSKGKKIVVDQAQPSADVVEEEENSDLTGDYKNVAILLFLYILQGIPIGISSAMRILLQNRGVSYKEQAILSFASYPFTSKLSMIFEIKMNLLSILSATCLLYFMIVKILWAPLVDVLYIKRIGRRKTWLIPVQFLIAIFMLFLAQHVNELLGSAEGQKPQIVLLTIVFFFLFFLTATQDIVGLLSALFFFFVINVLRL